MGTTFLSATMRKRKLEELEKENEALRKENEELREIRERLELYTRRRG